MHLHVKMELDVYPSRYSYDDGVDIEQNVITDYLKFHLEFVNYKMFP